jgi:hypothetical protein
MFPVLDVLIEWLIRVLVRCYREVQALGWERREARVDSVLPARGHTAGSQIAEIHYWYKVAAEHVTACNRKPFFIGRSMDSYLAQFSGNKTVWVRVSPADSSRSVLFDGDNAIRHCW